MTLYAVSLAGFVLERWICAIVIWNVYAKLRNV